MRKSLTCSLKTSALQLKFKPDHDSASMEYERAAVRALSQCHPCIAILQVCYKNASRKEDARQMYLEAARQHELNNNMYKCARYRYRDHSSFYNTPMTLRELLSHHYSNKEQAAIICKDLGDLAQAKALMETAAKLYEENGTAEVAVNALEKAAKFFEGQDDQKAIEVRIFVKCLEDFHAFRSTARHIT